MTLQHPVSELIRRRYSCRTYTAKPIEKQVRRDLEDLLTANTSGPLGTRARFKLIAATPARQDALKDLGTYGFIRGATGYVVGAVPDTDYNLEDYGYLMEKTILGATGLGLGTCWLGGSFTKSTFAESISVRPHEGVPAVAAVGHPAGRKRLFEKAIRWGAGSDNRKPASTLFFRDDFQSPLAAVDNGLEPLAMVRLAPSASNRQPWRVVVADQQRRFHFYLQRTKRYYTRNRILFNMADLQRVDMGIAMCHFELSGRELGQHGHWASQDPGLGDLPDLTEYVATWFRE
jgi:nitroreductase